MDFADQSPNNPNNNATAGQKQQLLPYNDQFVVVDEAEWKLHCPLREMCTHFSTHLGGYEWKCNFMFQSKLRLECKELVDGTRADEVLMELYIHVRKQETDQYSLCNNGKRILFSPVNDHWFYQLDREERPWDTCLGWRRGRGAALCSQRGCGSSSVVDNTADGIDAPPTMQWPAKFILITARVLKPRKEFPDFTLDKPIGHLAPNCKLAVGNTTFHVNKQWLASQSPYFDRMFYGAANGDGQEGGGFVETKQDVIETGETDAAAYHDFLLAICPTTKDRALANRQNLAQIFHLAHYYEVVSLGAKLENTLKLCREMDKEERIELASKYCDPELLASLVMQDVHTLEDAKRLCISLITSVEK